jgi:hypothetical protein
MSSRPGHGAPRGTSGGGLPLTPARDPRRASLGEHTRTRTATQSHQHGAVPKAAAQRELGARHTAEATLEQTGDNRESE